MPSYLHPGVYVEELPSGSRPIEGVPTSTACFIGYTARGPMTKPTLINNWDAYERNFGAYDASHGVFVGLRDATITVAGAAAPIGDPMGHALSTFFLNGGSVAYIVRLADGATAASGNINDGGVLLTVTAANEGAWGDDLVFRLTTKAGDGGNVFLAEVGTGTGDDFNAIETLGEVVPETGEPTSMEATINAASKLVQINIPDGK